MELKDKYEYLDHTADIQIHSWGATLKEAFENATIAMFGYITDLSLVEVVSKRDISIEGHDLKSLLYAFLDEFLFIFSADYFVIRDVSISKIDLENFKIEATGFGEEWNSSKHKQGTEVKAITYSNMQIISSENKTELYVIIDI